MELGSYYPEDKKERIYSKTQGHCYICGKKLSYVNYGTLYAKAPWVVEHKKPKAKGGSDNIRNLWPACINCNLEKGGKYPYDFLYDYVDGEIMKLED